MSDLVERLRFLASGQDDVHSVAIAEAADRIEALEADARRYRWLRNVSAGCIDPVPFICGPDDLAMWGDEADAAVDAAIAQQTAQEGEHHAALNHHTTSTIPK